MRFKVALLAIAVVFLVHIVGLLSGWYQSWLQMDVLMHGLGGLAMGLLGLALLTNAEDKLAFWQKAIFVVGFAVLVGVIWEFMEYGVEHYQLIYGVAWEPLTLSDTLADLTNDLIGAFLSLIFLKRY